MGKLRPRRLTAPLGLALLFGLGACLPGPREDEREGVRSAAVTASSPAPGDASVVAIVGAAGALVCSATLVTPRVVLTAAHCGVTSTNHLGFQVFFGEAVGGPGTRVEIVDARTHPLFDPETLTHDLTLLYLREHAPVAPKPILEEPLKAAQIGSIARVVGYGMTGSDASDHGARRQGTAKVAEIAAADFTLSPSPSQPCSYDSGGAVLLTVGATEVLAGVVSHGDVACADYSRHARVDAALDFIRGYIADASSGRVEIGQRCFEDAQCREGTCWSPPDEPRASYCSRECSSDVECAGLACAVARDGTSRCQHPLPSPYAPGASCEGDEDCVGAPCLKVPDQPQVCAPTCSAAAPSCPEGFSCARVDTIRHACMAEAEAPPRSSARLSGGGGCSVGGSARDPHGGVAWLMAVVAAALGRARVPRRAKRR